MKGGMKVWVPGEECDGGLLVTDLETGAKCLVREGEFTELDIPLGNGRMTSRPAVRAKLVRADANDPSATARLPDGREVRFRILVGWQLGAGDGKRPPVEPAKSAGAGSATETAAEAA